MNKTRNTVRKTYRWKRHVYVHKGVVALNKCTWRLCEVTTRSPQKTGNSYLGSYVHPGKASMSDMMATWFWRNRRITPNIMQLKVLSMVNRSFKQVTSYVAAQSKTTQTFPCFFSQSTGRVERQVPHFTCRWHFVCGRSYRVTFFDIAFHSFDELLSGLVARIQSYFSGVTIYRQRRVARGLLLSKLSAPSFHDNANSQCPSFKVGRARDLAATNAYLGTTHTSLPLELLQDLQTWCPWSLFPTKCVFRYSANCRLVESSSLAHSSLHLLLDVVQTLTTQTLFWQQSPDSADWPFRCSGWEDQIASSCTDEQQNFSPFDLGKWDPRKWGQCFSYSVRNMLELHGWNVCYAQQIVQKNTSFPWKN